MPRRGAYPAWQLFPARDEIHPRYAAAALMDGGATHNYGDAETEVISLDRPPVPKRYTARGSPLSRACFTILDDTMTLGSPTASAIRSPGILIAHIFIAFSYCASVQQQVRSYACFLVCFRFGGAGLSRAAGVGGFDSPALLNPRGSQNLPCRLGVDSSMTTGFVRER